MSTRIPMGKYTGKFFDAIPSASDMLPYGLGLHKVLRGIQVLVIQVTSLMAFMEQQ